MAQTKEDILFWIARYYQMAANHYLQSLKVYAKDPTETKFDVVREDYSVLIYMEHLCQSVGLDMPELTKDYPKEFQNYFNVFHKAMESFAINRFSELDNEYAKLLDVLKGNE